MSSKFDYLYERVVTGVTPAKRPVKYTFSDQITDEQGKEFINFLEQNTKLSSDMRTLDSVPLNDNKWNVFWNVVQDTAKKQNALYTTSSSTCADNEQTHCLCVCVYIFVSERRLMAPVSVTTQ
jgi:hypothetical protein